jgi:hypothetical protein
LALYDAAPPADRSSGDMLAARLGLGRAYLLQTDLDGLASQLGTVLAAPRVRRTASIMKRTASIAKTLESPTLAGSAQSKQLRDEIAAFCAVRPALPAATRHQERA